jgi:hypothetical protein
MTVSRGSGTLLGVVALPRPATESAPHFLQFTSTSRVQARRWDARKSKLRVAHAAPSRPLEIREPRGMH